MSTSRNKTYIEVSYQTQTVPVTVNVNGINVENYVNLEIPIIKQYIDNSCPIDGPVNVRYHHVQHVQCIPNPYMFFNPIKYMVQSSDIDERKSKILLNAVKPTQKEETIDLPLFSKSTEIIVPIGTDAAKDTDAGDNTDSGKNTDAAKVTDAFKDTNFRTIKYKDIKQLFTKSDGKSNVVQNLKTPFLDAVKKNTEPKQIKDVKPKCDDIEDNPFIMHDDEEEDSDENEKINNEYYSVLDRLENIVDKFVIDKIYSKIEITEELTGDILEMFKYYSSFKGIKLLKEVGLISLEDKLREIIDEKYNDCNVAVTFNHFPNPIVHKRNFRVNIKKSVEVLKKETDEFIDIIIRNIPEYIKIGTYDKLFLKTFFTEDELEKYRPYLTNKVTRDKFLDLFEDKYKDEKFTISMPNSFEYAYLIGKNN